jgi:hypothetical protein
MTKDGIIKLLSEFNKEDVEKFASYCMRLLAESKNDWMQRKTDEAMAELFRRVNRDGLVFDGEHITLQKTGISYDWVALKNKMLLTYPESTVDVALVYDKDEFTASKDSGSVVYSHKIGDPFGQKDANVIGGYCVIKNKRGEFITLLNKEDFEKHRKVAKTDFIWKQWYMAMCMKTLMKKACKQHFADVYQSIEDEDNKQNDLDNPLDLELRYKQEIDAIETLDALKAYYLKNKGQGKSFDQYIAMKKKYLTTMV